MEGDRKEAVSSALHSQCIITQIREFYSPMGGSPTSASALRDWAAADRIREELAKQGIALEDTPEGTKWRKA